MYNVKELSDQTVFHFILFHVFFNVVRCTPLLLQWRGGRYFYIRAMTEHQKRILRRHQKVLFGDDSVRCFGSFDVDKVFGAATLLDIDTHYSHKRAGFKSCEEYYYWCSSRNYIDKVSIESPLLNNIMEKSDVKCSAESSIPLQCFCSEVNDGLFVYCIGICICVCTLCLCAV